MLKIEDRVTPVKDWVLIEVFKAGEEFIRGIIIPDKGKLTNYGKVLKVGPGRVNRKGVRLPMDLKVGDIVYIANLGRCEWVKNDENRYILLCAEPLIEGVVEDFQLPE